MCELEAIVTTVRNVFPSTLESSCTYSVSGFTYLTQELTPSCLQAQDAMDGEWSCLAVEDPVKRVATGPGTVVVQRQEETMVER